MLPAVAILGRPNVGKSTLFNLLTGSRDALVADQPGLTRDRQYGIVRREGASFIVVDTGGYFEDDDSLTRKTVEQARLAEEEAHVVLLMVDAREGLGPADERIAERVRRLGKPVVLAVNKVDGVEWTAAAGEFHRLGFAQTCPIAAAHGRGISELLALTRASLPSLPPGPEAPHPGIRIAVVGRPNVGKSTLVNRLVGAERVIADDRPGTTRDSVHVPLERDGKPYVLVDTAGIRRRPRVEGQIEKLSVVKALQAIEACDVALMLLDAGDGLAEQDARLLGSILEAGRALVLAVNKWDALGAAERPAFRSDLDRRLRFVSFADLHFVSALRGWGLDRVFASIDAAHRSATRSLSTPALTRILAEAVEGHPPPLVRGRRIKLRYAHQGGSHPPLIVIHGNQTAAVPDAYRRYLMRAFRDGLKLRGTPIRIELRTGDNPYRGKRNEPSARQLRRRKRLLRHVKRR